MLFVEQYPLSVISGATLPERFPEQVTIGIESSTLNSVKSKHTKVFITLESLFILLLKA
tara:strand:+ start:301 stop:477 length:177 start_codon:yes stop_codon:yes gene_type:complete